MLRRMRETGGYRRARRDARRACGRTMARYDSSAPSAACSR
ncbi:hypothetical protein GLE_2563 [Lysobacter enzymogenes]|uniref:Uncharacterized protein n=1 Tax=Lysobacter enzymogenes TaxID=69 RepID=A0A0S2DHQ5_LYSEN|nr:hypothetical protein GLE_2563 [Lysobacter enzymogenes]